MDDPSYTEARAAATASIVLRKTLAVKAGETVAIESWSSTLPWALAFVREARRIGARPVMLFEDDETYWKSATETKPSVLGAIGRHELGLLEKTDAYVFFWGPSDTVRFEKLDEEQRGALTAFNDTWYSVANRARLRLARMYLGRVSPATARHYRIGYAEWRNEVVEGTLVDPEVMHVPGKRIAQRFTGGSRVTVDHPNGTHLELRLKHRQANLFSGLYTPEPRARRGAGHAPGVRDTPMPAGVVSVAVDEEFAEGTFVSNAPSHSRDSPWWGARWEFSGGHLVSHRYLTGGGEFDRAIALGRHGRDQPGSVSIGLNPKLHEAPLMVDQELGTVTISLGSNRYMGGTTEAGFLTWASLRGADVAVDGTPVVRKGHLSVR